MRFECRRPRLGGSPHGFTGLIVKSLLAGKRFLPTWGNTLVAAVVECPAGFDIVSKVGVEDRNQPPPSGCALDRHQQLDSPVQVTGHPIGTRNVHPFVAAPKEVEDTCVFQEPVDDADHGDIFAETGYARLEATDATNVELHDHSGLRRSIESVDDRGIDERVEFWQRCAPAVLEPCVVFRRRSTPTTCRATRSVRPRVFGIVAAGNSR